MFYILLLYVFSVFWDLYCAAPERRDTCEHSSEAKAFHDYVRISMIVNTITISNVSNIKTFHIIFRVL